MKIISVIGKLSDKGLTFEEIQWDAIELAKTYKLSRVDSYGDKQEKFVKKQQLHKIEMGVMLNSNTRISFFARCYPERVDEFTKRITEQIQATALKFKNEIDNLVKHIK